MQGRKRRCPRVLARSDPPVVVACLRPCRSQSPLLSGCLPLLVSFLRYLPVSMLSGIVAVHLVLSVGGDSEALHGETQEEQQQETQEEQQQETQEEHGEFDSDYDDF